MRGIVGIAVALFCAGCQGSGLYTADVSFSRSPGLGYRNAGLQPVGKLYLFDQQAGTLSPLHEGIPLARRPDLEAPVSLTETNIGGIGVSGSFPSPAAKAELAAAIGTKVSFVVENAVRERYEAVYTGLANAYRDGIAKGEDMPGQWYVNDVVSRPGFFYVVVSGVVRADKASLSVGGVKDDNTVDISLNLPGFATPARVTVTNGRSTQCMGKAAACFLELSVIKPYFGPQKRLSFRGALGVDADKLSEALRSLP